MNIIYKFTILFTAKMMGSFNLYLKATKYTKYMMINEINFKVTSKSHHTLINYIIFISKIAHI